MNESGNIDKSKKDTSWQKVAGWYDKLLEEDNETFQAKVILPNLLRLMDINKGEAVLDVACGQGFFSREFKNAGAKVTGTDLSKDLIKFAQSKDTSPAVASKIQYFVTPSDSMPMLKDASFDKACIVLALQNIKKAGETISEIYRLLKPEGKLYIVLNHPAFRIPKNSGWEFDEKTKTQFRKIFGYMSEQETSIDMHPGKKDSPKTISFHRPLQWYVKAFYKANFALIRLEEWISHKESQKGPRQLEEDRIRKEIPMFMCVELKKL